MELHKAKIMKIDRLNRSYINAYTRLTRQDKGAFNAFEFRLGLDYIETKVDFRLYDFSRSTVFWNWFCQQTENIMQQAFIETGINHKDYVLNKMEMEGLISAWKYFYLDFLSQDIRPSKTVSNQIINEYRRKNPSANTGNQNAVSEQPFSSQHAAIIGEDKDASNHATKTY